jgi:hypothetical protein
MTKAESLKRVVKELSSSVDMLGADDAQLERLRRIQSAESVIRTSGNEVVHLFAGLKSLNDYLGRTTDVKIQELSGSLSVVKKKDLIDLANWESESLSELSDEMKTIHLEVKNAVESNWMAVRSEIQNVLALAKILDDESSVLSAPIRLLQMYSSDSVHPDNMAEAIERLKVVKQLIQENGADDEDVRQFLIGATTSGVALDDLEKSSIKKWLTPQRRERFCIRIKNQ